MWQSNNPRRSTSSRSKVSVVAEKQHGAQQSIAERAKHSIAGLVTAEHGRAMQTEHSREFSTAEHGSGA